MTRGCAPWDDLATPNERKPRAERKTLSYCKRCARPKSRHNPNQHCHACMYELAKAAVKEPDRPSRQITADPQPDSCPLCGSSKLTKARMCFVCRRNEINSMLGRRP